MKRLFFTMLAACMTAAIYAGTVNYTALPDSIFPNPERGFLHQCTRHANGSYNAITSSKKTEIETYMSQDKITLVLVLYYLDEFRETETLPDAVFTAFEEDMQVLRNYGIKAILRIAYAENSYGSGDGESAQDASLAIIEKHLAQYKSHWAANADVIYCFQAGFVGQYGEWYYTDNFGNHVPTMTADCKALLDTALKAIPQDRTLLLRRPMFKEEYLDGVALTEEEAYTGTKKARLGHFNDAFLYQAYNNMGTYTDTARQKPFIAQETLYVPIGGESDITDPEQAAREATYELTIAEMSRMHWSFIKNTYAEAVTNMWRANGTFDTLNVHMGYRFQLLNGTYSEAVTAGNNLSVNMNIKNVGYAPLYNERHAYIVLKNENATYKLRLSVDPRTWKPNGVISTINENVIVPDTALNGTYDLYLWLPDAYESLQNDARYAVRFANNGVWEEASGMNALGAQVVVSGGQDVPEPGPEPVTPSVPLPATLNKANHSAVSDEKWYNTDYFNFGDAWGEDGSDGYNLSRWIEWKVNLKYPGQYIISEAGYYPNGHYYTLQLINSSGDTIQTYTTEETYAEGDISIQQTTNWNLTSVTEGIYTLRVKNALTYGKPKLKSLTLTYDGELPTDVEQTEADNADTQAYDILGRPVDESYHGIVIMRGKKILR